MKHIDLQASLAYLRTLYQAYEADGIQISGSTMSVSSYADFAYFKYLLFLANLDHVITEEEITFLNRCLYQSISEPMVKSLLQQYTISFSSVQSTLLSLLAALVQADYRSDNHTDGSVSLLLLETLEQMGKQFAITTAGEVGAQQNLTIQTMIQQLSRYWNASMQERKRVDRSRAATVPEDLAAGKPPVPLSKEPVITDADVTDAPTETLEELMEHLHALTGLQAVKEELDRLIHLLKIRAIRQQRGLPLPQIAMHMVFSGNPGTGKTTVARLLAKIYARLGVLKKGHLVEADRTALVSGYVGQTAIKTKKVIDQARGGVLFLDEAYTLTSGATNHDFGMEAVQTILKEMEDNRDDLIVIAAGYPEEMEQFLDANPGLRSRFRQVIFFSDYTPDELYAIFSDLCEGYCLTVDPDAQAYVKSYFSTRSQTTAKSFANARDVRNFFEFALTNQANRLVKIGDSLSDAQLLTLTLEDVTDIVLA
ncbi:MAG: AAA family ATPase [Ruminococcus sp.]|nr:AAA family ATPase [Ruminococcus sp.]